MRDAVLAASSGSFASVRATAVAEDHARLLGMIGRYLAEIGFRSSLTFHNLILYAETFRAPSRYEPEPDVFWQEEDRPGIALRIILWCLT